MENIKGERFGKLVVIEPTENRQNCHIIWHCKCDCGNDHFVIGSVLKAGVSTSCGCVRRNRLLKHGGAGTRIYNIWKLMRSRCNNHNRPRFHRWGGRGITIFHEWNDFNIFKKWALESGYSDNLEIDRINNNDSYTPTNCQWITKSKHSRKSHIDTPQGLKNRYRDKLGRLVTS